MTGRTRWIFFFLFSLTRSDDELRWNTPPNLTTGAAAKESRNNDAIQPRFLPISASFSVAAGGSNAHSLSLSGSTSKNDQLVGYAGSSAEANANYLHNQHKNKQYGRPYWTNISPNYGHGGFASSNPYRPTLEIDQRPQGWSPPNRRRPSQLDISIGDRWNKRVPEVRIIDNWQYEYGNTQIGGIWNPYSCYRRPYRFLNSREEYEWNSRCFLDEPPYWYNQHYQKPSLKISASSSNSGGFLTE
ncbi:uncharacterized protein LOC117178761 [Belonocnema kinseyi]|uniref:uncharacterized protein LOC117178761 n=1 Tax=Belonocnema kinseyi TaxID=2817044 RepID=UPI00143D80DC|nr:uncharacterized protein LOC117178761 [Belonocnema kinseyi]